MLHHQIIKIGRIKNVFIHLMKYLNFAPGSCENGNEYLGLKTCQKSLISENILAYTLTRLLLEVSLNFTAAKASRHITVLASEERLRSFVVIRLASEEVYTLCCIYATSYLTRSSFLKYQRKRHSDSLPN